MTDPQNNEPKNPGAGPAENAQTAPPPNNGKRRGRLIALGAVLIVAAIVYTLYWFLHARFYEETDDAYVASDLVQITSEVAGAVSVLNADDTQQVQQGQVLVELDPADAQIAMASAEAELARSVRQVRGLFSQSSGLQAQIRESQVSLQSARADLARRETVAADGAVSSEEVQHARDRIAQLEAALSSRNENLANATARIDNTQITSNPEVLAAEARVRQAALALRRTRILAPVAGTVARRSVQIGAQIAAGTPLMAVVPLNDVWVDANFKEVQLADLRVGQPVELSADFYGGKATYHGRVMGLGAGSGSAFALLPAQNASGNWIKIVQRIPVRISLDPKELEKYPLRVGLSIKAKIDMHDTSGTLANSQVRAIPQRVIASLDHDPGVDRRIAEIIAANTGGMAAGTR